MEKCNIFVGRFQPVTVGHIKCIKKAYDEYGLKTVLCIIDVPSNKVNDKHPFVTDTVLPLYREVLSKYDCIIDIIKVKSADIVKISEECEKLGYRIASWTCGEDRKEDYTRMSARYSDKANLTDDFKMIILDRQDGISATMVRGFLLNNQVFEWFKYTPFITDWSFDFFAEQLKQVI